jgi:uncharacterized membrane protein
MITPAIILALLIAPLVFVWIRSYWQGQEFQATNAIFWGLASAFFFFFVGHMVKGEGMISMLPPWVPQRAVLVFLSGVLELSIAIGLMFPKTRTCSARVAIVLLVVFFPVNIYAAMHHVGLGGHQLGPVYLFLRAPLQLVLIAWAWWAIKKA